MSPTVNTYLGIAFLVLGLGSTLLMYHLWGYPYDKEKMQSSAPRWMMNLHRLMGYAFLAIYIVLMWQMVPRLWNYQIELPARTVVHLTCGIMIGAILILKISIVTMFRHLEGTLVPALGTMLMLCTFLVISLSVPFALRESYLRSQALPNSMAGADALLRVNRLLEEAGQSDEGFRGELASLEGLNSGREVLYSSCTQCHDLRTVLARQRTPKNWWSTVKRMAGMSNLLDPIDEREQWQVTAYLIAISPDLQQSAGKRKNPDTTVVSSDAPDATPSTNVADATAVSFTKPADYQPDLAQALYEETCSQCHKLAKVDNYEFTSNDDVLEIVDRMIDDEELELEKPDKETILFYMSQLFSTQTAPAGDTSNAPDNPTDKVVVDETPEVANETPADEPSQAEKQSPVAKPKNYSKTIGKFLYENKCSECHNLKRVEKYDFNSYADGAELVDRMVDDEGMQVNDKEKSFLKYFLYDNFTNVTPK